LKEIMPLFDSWDDRAPGTYTPLGSKMAIFCRTSDIPGGKKKTLPSFFLLPPPVLRL
jgi:hypothetical protein